MEGATPGLEHEWTLQVLDGVQVMTDMTWADTGGGTNFANVVKSATYFKRNHYWIESDYNQKWNNTQDLIPIQTDDIDEDDLDGFEDSYGEEEY